jgi:hypothetical protein
MLSERSSNYHLALRNLLASKIDDTFVVKVSDFGLSRALETDYYRASTATLPIKWTAPEVRSYCT